MGSRPLFSRPIEITNSTDSYRVVYNIGGGNLNADITPGVYADIAALLRALSYEATATVGSSVIWKLHDATDYIACRCTSSASLTLTAGANLRVIIGDPANAFGSETTSTAHTSAYQSSHIWVPPYQNATQSVWALKPGAMGVGTITKTGENVGNATGPDIYYRSLRFTNVPAAMMTDEAATDAYVKAYTWEKFVKGAMWSSPEESGNPSTRGFFFWPDVEFAIAYPAYAPGGDTGTSQVYMGIHYNYGSITSRFTFCQFAENAVDIMRASNQHGLSYYETGEFEIHTIDSMPIWESPIV